MVSRIQKTSREIQLARAYRIVRGHLDSVQSVIGENLTITVCDNSLPKRQKSGESKLETSLRKEIGFRRGDDWSNYEVPQELEPYQIFFHIEGRKVMELEFDWWPYKHILYEYWVIVKEGFRGHGIGTLLMDGVENAARRLGANKLYGTGIIPGNLNYWKQRSDYRVQGDTAIKILRK